jgi:hypothetical protein
LTKHTTLSCKTPPWWIHISRNTSRACDQSFLAGMKLGLRVSTWKLLACGCENTIWTEWLSGHIQRRIWSIQFNRFLSIHKMFHTVDLYFCSHNVNDHPHTYNPVRTHSSKWCVWKQNMQNVFTAFWNYTSSSQYSEGCLPCSLS